MKYRAVFSCFWWVDHDGQYLIAVLWLRAPSRGFKIFITRMIQNRSKGHVTSQIQFVRTCFINSLLKHAFMTNGLLVDGAAANMIRKYNLENNATIEKLSMRSMNEFYLDNSFCVKTIALYKGREVRHNRHEFKNKSKARIHLYYPKEKKPCTPNCGNCRILVGRYRCNVLATCYLRECWNSYFP
jgi:hypothetical protein